MALLTRRRHCKILVLCEQEDAAQFSEYAMQCRDEGSPFQATLWQRQAAAAYERMWLCLSFLINGEEW